MSSERVHLPHRDWRAWGRPVYPVALGIGVLMATLTAYNALNTGVLRATLLGDIVMVLAGASLVMLVAGWVTQRQVMVATGLLTAASAYVARMLFIAFTLGIGAEGVWLSLGTVVIAGGSYLLEVRDA